MAKYDSSMYQSLSEYVVSHTDEIKDPKTIQDYFAYCENNEWVSFEYAGFYCDSHAGQNQIDLIEKPMKEWFKQNDIDWSEFWRTSTAHGSWMARNIPDTYQFLFHKLLLDVAKHQNIIK